MSHISVLGSGAWGIALASKLAVNHNKVIVWGRNEETVREINQQKHPSHPGKLFSKNIEATTDISFAVKNAQAVLLCTPSNALLDTIEKTQNPPSKLAWATKGLSANGRLFSDEIKERFGIEGAFITGPSFADDVVQNKPTAILVAGEEERNLFWKKSLHTADFRPYTSNDIAGAQVGAALKNIIAIAVGVCDGLGFGSNAQAALITRGLKEINELSKHFSGDTKTLYGLSGLGDVILTSMSNQSRNRRYGFSLAQNKMFNQLAEGKKAVEIVHQIMNKAQIDLPICEAVYKITHLGATPQKEASALLKRELKAE